jgi:hypothetical protein
LGPVDAYLFRVICDRDMEGVVAKQASAKYTGSNNLGQDKEPVILSGQGAGVPSDPVTKAEARERRTIG